MRCRTRLGAVALTAATAALCGCDSAPKEELVLPDWLTESPSSTAAAETGQSVADAASQPAETPPETTAFAAASPLPVSTAPSVTVASQGGAGTPQPNSAASVFATAAAANPGNAASTVSPNATAAGPAAGSLSLASLSSSTNASNAGAESRFRIGDRSRYRRTLETTVRQASEGQPTVTFQSRLEATFAIKVASVEPDRTGLEVTFDRFVSERSRGGQTVRFDTDDRSDTSAFAPLVGRPVVVWIDLDNRLLSIDGRESLLGDLLASLPASIRGELGQALATEPGLRAVFGDVADLHPRQLQSGSEWTVPADRPNAFARRFEVLETARDAVRLAFNGDAPAVSQPLQTASGLRIQFGGGTLQGEATLDPTNGWPVSTRSIESLTMQVQPTDGDAFSQHTQTVATLVTLPPSDPPSATPAATSMPVRLISQPAAASGGVTTPPPYFTR